MVDRPAGLTRRQFLIVGAGGSAALWASRIPASALAVPNVGVVTDAGLSLRQLPFADDFADDTLRGWNVRRAVAILGTTAFGLAHPNNALLDSSEFLRGRGTVVGLDGPLGTSTGPGLIETVDRFVFTPGSHTLRFTIAGSHQSGDHMPPSTVIASLPGLGASRSVIRRPTDDFLEFTLDVAVTRPSISTIVLASGDAPGQAGVLLESVSLARAD